MTLHRNNLVILINALALIALLCAVVFQGWGVYHAAKHRPVIIDQDELLAVKPKALGNGNLAVLLNANLMGNSQQAVKKQTKTVRKSTLNLSLIGVIASDDPLTARALIKSGRQKAYVYSIDESIKGVNAKLAEVHANKVLINRNGAIESIVLKRQIDNSKGNDGRQAEPRAIPTSAARQKAQAIDNNIDVNRIASKLLQLASF